MAGHLRQFVPISGSCMSSRLATTRRTVPQANRSGVPACRRVWRVWPQSGTAGVPVLTDVHSVEEALAAAAVVRRCCKSQRSCAGKPTRSAAVSTDGMSTSRKFPRPGDMSNVVAKATNSPWEGKTPADGTGHDFRV